MTKFIEIQKKKFKIKPNGMTDLEQRDLTFIVS